jgi:hypothetical protein
MSEQHGSLIKNPKQLIVMVFSLYPDCYTFAAIRN